MQKVIQPWLITCIFAFALIDHFAYGQEHSVKYNVDDKLSSDKNTTVINLKDQENDDDQDDTDDDMYTTQRPGSSAKHHLLSLDTHTISRLRNMIHESHRHATDQAREMGMVKAIKGIKEHFKDEKKRIKGKDKDKGKGKNGADPGYYSIPPPGSGLPSPRLPPNYASPPGPYGFDEYNYFGHTPADSYNREDRLNNQAGPSSLINVPVPPGPPTYAYSGSTQGHWEFVPGPMPSQIIPPSGKTQSSQSPLASSSGIKGVQEQVTVSQQKSSQMQQPEGMPAKELLHSDARQSSLFSGLHMPNLQSNPLLGQSNLLSNPLGMNSLFQPPKLPSLPTLPTIPTLPNLQPVAKLPAPPKPKMSIIGNEGGPMALTNDNVVVVNVLSGW